MAAAWWLTGLVALACVVGCGDEGGDDDGTPGTGANSGGGFVVSGGMSSGGAGGTSSGGATSGGTSSGGATSGGAGANTGGAAGAAHCTPGQALPYWQYYPTIFDECDDIPGIGDGNAGFRDITLSAPVGPGQSFAFSSDVLAPEGDFEVWGATEKCGTPQELLSTVHVTGDGVLCHEVRPANGTYSHLIWVWNTAVQQRDTAMCDNGTCPSP